MMAFMRFVFLLSLLACDGGGASLIADLRTDLVPDVEFDSIEVFLDEVRVAEPAPDSSADYITGVRIADLDVESGLHRIRVDLRLAGVVVARRTVQVLVRGNTATTIVITRDCRAIDCPEACRNGVCVDAECTPETPDACPDGCARDDECPMLADCAAAACVGGSCLYADRGECGIGLYCDPDLGCRPSPDVDAGTDAGVDVGVDAPTDAPPDVVDAPPDVFDAAPPSCEELFAGLDAFLLCEQRAGECEFYTSSSPAARCSEICATAGRTCVGGFVPGTPELCAGTTGYSCTSNAISDVICVCTR